MNFPNIPWLNKNHAGQKEHTRNRKYLREKSSKLFWIVEKFSFENVQKRGTHAWFWFALCLHGSKNGLHFVWNENQFWNFVLLFVNHVSIVSIDVSVALKYSIPQYLTGKRTLVYTKFTKVYNLIMAWWIKSLHVVCSIVCTGVIYVQKKVCTCKLCHNRCVNIFLDNTQRHSPQTWIGHISASNELIETNQRKHLINIRNRQILLFCTAYESFPTIRPVIEIFS